MDAMAVKPQLKEERLYSSIFRGPSFDKKAVLISLVVQSGLHVSLIYDLPAPLKPFILKPIDSNIQNNGGTRRKDHPKHAL